jgi:two-component system NarL family response regulator
MTIRVTIADDHALFREGLLSLLRLRGDVEVVAEIDRADDIAPSLDRSPCDVLLLDLQMDRNAFTDIEAFSRRVAVVVVTASERIEDAIASMRAGARAFVFKRFAVETLMTAVRSVVDGHVWLPPEIQAAMNARLHDPGEGLLTSRELEITRQVALGFRNAEIAARLGISEPTVKSHVNNVFQKLRIRDRVELTRHAIRTGIVGVDERRR